MMKLPIKILLQILDSLELIKRHFLKKLSPMLEIHQKKLVLILKQLYLNNYNQSKILVRDLINHL